MKKILILAVVALIMPICSSAQEIRHVVPETSLLVGEDSYVVIYDPASKSRVTAFRSTKEFVVDIKYEALENEEYRVPFPPELSSEDSFIISSMNSKGFSVTKTSPDITVLGFDLKSRIWIPQKVYSSE